jgi:hypothetical protein
VFHYNETNKKYFDTYATYLVGSDGQKVSIIMVPSFGETGCCALLNLRTLECLPVFFSSTLKHGNVEEMQT